MRLTRILLGWLAVGLLLGSLACSSVSSSAEQAAAKVDAVPDDAGVATFAGGCFWCMEAPFEKLEGVYSVTSGYTGGTEENPSYQDVSASRTGHAESIRIRYDTTRVSYEQLLDLFWRQIDPTDSGGQFADRGPQYRTAIFWHDETQRRLAETSREALGRSGRFEGPIVTAVEPAGPFYPAEDYHQDFYKKNPARYGSYRQGSGREGFLQRVWGPEKRVERSEARNGGEGAGLRERLTPLQYHVTQENGTEPPFDNDYWDNEREGIYVDVVSGEPLFSSGDKFKSRSGWPSFTRPLEPANVVEREDRRLLMARTEIRSRGADSHLGHLFDDGPQPTGQRYCINSAALRFVPKEDLEKEGYGEYSRLFD